LPAVLRWISWGIGLLALASAFVPISHGLAHALSWVLCVYSVLGAGMALGQRRKGAFMAYAALAIVMNPIAPFHFQAQVWRLIYAAAGIWLIGEPIAGMF
jgi:hypothetical protein